MKKKLFNPIALICSLLFVVAVFADPNGSWIGTISIPDGSQIDLTYKFKVEGDKLTGTVSTPAGDATVDNGKIVDDKFSFSVNVSGTDYQHSGKFYADSCSLDIGFGGTKVHTTLKRPK